MSDELPSAATRAMNLGPNGRRARRNVGLVGLVTGLLLMIVLIAADSPRLVRLLVVVPFSIGLAGLLQAQGGT